MSFEDFPFEHFFGKKENDNLNKIQIKSDNSKTANSISESFGEEEINAINEEIHNSLKLLINSQKYSTFFKETFWLKSVDQESVTFEVSTNFIKTVINNSLDQISSSIFQVLGQEYKINIIVKEETSTNSKPSSASEVKFSLDIEPKPEELIDKVESKYIDHIQEENEGIIIDLTKNFSNFVVGPSNNMAYAAAKAITSKPGKAGKYPSLYIHSNSGLGKTHLLHAIANGIKFNFPQYIICLITARDFMKEMIDAMKENNIHEFRLKYSEKVDILMIDDVHELKGKEGTQREFFHVFNELYNKGKQLIFTSDKSPQEINGLEDRIRTRLQWGLVVDIQKPDFETRIAIIKKKASELDLFLSEDIINLIACNIKNSIRELEGALIKLSAFSDIMKVDIDIEIVKDVLLLKEYEDERKITIEDITKATSQHLKIPVADMKSKSRTKNITRARFIAMYLSRKIINATHDEIGKYFGGRDHSSVVHAEQKITKELSYDQNLSKIVMTVENLI